MAKPVPSGTSRSGAAFRSAPRGLTREELPGYLRAILDALTLRAFDDARRSSDGRVYSDDIEAAMVRRLRSCPAVLEVLHVDAVGPLAVTFAYRVVLRPASLAQMREHELEALSGEEPVE